MPNNLVPIEETTSPALQAAVDATADFIAASRSEATRRAYASDWHDFEAWCGKSGLIMLPATPASVAAYLSAMAIGEPPARLATIRRRVAAIAHVHRAAGHDNPGAHPGVRAVLTGIARTLGSAPTKKRALTADMLTAAIRKIPHDLAGLRDRALILIGFAGALRRSELVALDVADIGLHSKGIVLTIRRSKTDQAGAGAAKAIPHGKRLKPVDALQRWIVAARISDGPLFRAVRGATVLPGRLDPGSVARIIKRRVGAAGLDPELFAGHSLRSGYITTAADAGASLQAIAKHALHERVETTIGYVQVADAFKDHSGRRFL